MITLTREEAQQVLDAMMPAVDGVDYTRWAHKLSESVALLRDRLAEPVVCARCGEVNPAEIHTCTPKEQEPVGEVDRDGMAIVWANKPLNGSKLFTTAPPQREFVGLTDEERRSIREHQELLEKLGPVWAPMLLYYYLAIEAKLKEKNT